jgi:hypothetical protein
VQLLVVKRGRLSTFRMLMEQFAGVDDCQVIWDRRNAVANRRELASAVASERRGQERRRPQDRRGPAAEYVVVSVTSRVKTSGESR